MWLAGWCLMRATTVTGPLPKQVLTEIGTVDLDVPRDRNATFEPKIVPKGARRLERFNANIVALYAQGLSTRDIRTELARMYGVDISPALVVEGHRRDRRRADRVAEPPVGRCVSPFVHRCHGGQVRTDGTVVNCPAYVVVGVDVVGRRTHAGCVAGRRRLSAPNCWLSVLTEIRHRDLEDVLIVCCDGLRGLPDTIDVASDSTAT